MDSPANIQVVPYNMLPSPAAILKSMSIFTTKMALTAKMNIVFTDRIDIPPELPASPEYAVFRKYDGYQFTSRDLDLSTNSPFPRRVLINGWMKILSNNRVRALGREPNLRFFSLDTVEGYNYRFPHISEDTKDGSVDLKAIVWKPASGGSYILNRVADNHRKTITDRGMVGTYILPQQGHLNDCFCASTSSSNNMEFNLFSSICLPSLYFTDRKGKFDKFKASSPVKLNPTLLFFSLVSKHGLVCPELTFRQPLSLLSRGVAKKFVPPFANIDLEEHSGLLRDVYCATRRPEYVVFMRHFSEDSGSPDPKGNWFRHAPVEKQVLSVDMKAMGTESIDITLSNCVHVSPFWGPFSCPYCDTIINVTDISTVITHLVTEHLRLKTSLFSCPSCLTISLYTAKTFPNHFRKHHSPSLALMVVLLETNVHVRTAFGLALQSVLSVFGCLNEITNALSEVEISQGPDKYASELGGYVDMNSFPQEEYDQQASALITEIVAKRKETAPSEIDRTKYRKREKYQVQTPDSDNSDDSDHTNMFSVGRASVASAPVKKTRFQATKAWAEIARSNLEPSASSADLEPENPGYFTEHFSSADILSQPSAPSPRSISDFRKRKEPEVDFGTSSYPRRSGTDRGESLLDEDESAMQI
jgi:hypothetical protein